MKIIHDEPCESVNVTQWMSAAGIGTAGQEGAEIRDSALRPPPLRLFDSLQAAAPFWNVLGDHAVVTPFQRFDWLAAWCRHASPHRGERPLLVGIAGTDGRPLGLLPLGVTRRGGARVAQWLGGSHGNFNFGIWDPAAQRLEGRVLRALLAAAGREAGIDAFLLTQMPPQWSGMNNPLLRLGGFPSVERGYRGRLGPDPDAILAEHLSTKARRSLHRKERRLAEHGVVRVLRAQTPAEAARLLDSYLAEKGAWFRRHGIPDPFAEPGVVAFLGEATTNGLADGRPAIELYGYEVGGEILAVLGGAADGNRFCSMFSSMTEGELARYSPGLQLAVAVVSDLCRRGFTMFDLGVGDTPYKLQLCPEEEPLFDLAVPVSLRGRGVAAGWAALRRARRRAKQSPAVLAAVGRLRRLKASSAGHPRGKDAPRDGGVSPPL
jgi:CelD/BcsL family acetyltransferase involved in cellulose biosynthesis